MMTMYDDRESHNLLHSPPDQPFANIPNRSSHNKDISNKRSNNNNSTLFIVLISSVIVLLLAVIASLGLSALTLQKTINLSANSVNKAQLDPCVLHPLTCDTDSGFKNEYSHVPRSVLVVAAHPDDIETTAAGTLAKWASNREQPTEIYYILVTNGDKGTSNRSLTSEELGRIRKREQIRAGEVIGVKDIFFFNVPDGDVVNSDELRRNITYYVRLLRPEVVMTWDPTWHLDLFQYGLEHRDHRSTGQATFDSLWPNSNDFLYYPDMDLEPYRPKTVLLFRFWHDFEFNAPQSQVYVPLTEDDMQVKLNAIYQHDCQFPNEQAKESEKQFLMKMAQRFGKVVGTKYAELFTVVRLLT